MVQGFLMMISLTPSLSSGFFLFVCLPPFVTHTHTHTHTNILTYAPTHMHVWPNKEAFWSTNLWYHNETLYALHTLHLRNLHIGHKATVRTGSGTTDWFQIGKGVHQGCITLLVWLICRVHHEKRWTGRNTSWNQDCWEKYQ